MGILHIAYSKISSHNALRNQHPGFCAVSLTSGERAIAASRLAQRAVYALRYMYLVAR